MKTRAAQINLIPRHQDILALARQKGYLSTEELTRAFKVTSQTIRRDINELCSRGLLRRYHGGAGLASSVENVDYSARQVLNHDEKIRIGQMVAQMHNRVRVFFFYGVVREAEAPVRIRQNQKLHIVHFHARGAYDKEESG